MVHLILVNIREELRQLIVHICRICIVLNIKVAISEERQGGAVAWRELQLIVQDRDDFSVLSIADKRIDRLGVLSVGYRSESPANSIHMLVIGKNSNYN